MRFKPGDYISTDPSEFVWKVLEFKDRKYKLECVKWNKGFHGDAWRVGAIEWFPYDGDIERFNKADIWTAKQILECYSK